MGSPSDSFQKVKILNSHTIDYCGINILLLSQVFVFELSLGRLDNAGLLGLLKKYSLDSYLKALLAFRLYSNKKHTSAKYFFVNDVNNKSMITNLRTVEAMFDTSEVMELVCDKRLKQNNNVILFGYFRLFKYLKKAFQFAEVVRKNFKTIKTVSNEFGTKKRLLVLNLFESVFILNCIDNVMIRHHNTEKIILNTDVHKVSRAIVFKAKQANIETCVLQHGSTVLEYGYLPVYADIIFTWGALSSQWFKNRGTPDKKLKTIGTPKMDFLNNYDIKTQDKEEIKNVLLIVNPIGEDNVQALLNLVKTAQIHEHFSLSIKLHPGSVDNRDLVEKYFKKTPAKIYKDQNIHQLIHENDVVITTTSTVGNEAIAFYKPLIKINLEAVHTILEYDIYGCSISIDTPESLKVLLNNSVSLNSRKVNYQKFIEAYFFKLDGKSSRRIMEHITNY